MRVSFQPHHFTLSTGASIETQSPSLDGAHPLRHLIDSVMCDRNICFCGGRRSRGPVVSQKRSGDWRLVRFNFKHLLQCTDDGSKDIQQALALELLSATGVRDMMARTPVSSPCSLVSAWTKWTSHSPPAAVLSFIR